tara:strand:- start:4411 stop:4965 length:555 start_codon:yes stop_codon:yes gene_type:complete
MKKVFNNIYIDTFKSFDRSIDAELSDFYENDIKYIVNLTECNQLTANHRIALVCNKIKALDFFNDPELYRIKNIKPELRTSSEVQSRSTIRERIMGEKSKFLLDISKIDGNILFVCNRNNVLSPLFTFIIMHLQGNENYIKNIMKNKDVITSQSNKADVQKYLDKYKDIIYNKINEIPKQAVQR